MSVSRPPDLKFTGERVVPDKSDNWLYQVHLASYDYARPYVAGKSVLDFGCGCGYGTHHLAEVAQLVVGVDVAHDVVAYARFHYRRDNLNFCVMQDGRLPFGDGAFDAIVSVNVIEHVSDYVRCLRELCRVLKPDGVCVMATGNRLVSPAWRASGGPSRFHEREWSPAEFREVLEPHFERVELLGQDRRGKSVCWDPAWRRMAPIRLLRRLLPTGVKDTFKHIVFGIPPGPKLTVADFETRSANLAEVYVLLAVCHGPKRA